MVGIRKSITRRQNIVAQYITTRLILYLCEQATWRTGAQVYWRWWDQAGIYLEGARKQTAVSATISEMESEEESDREPTGATGGGKEESQVASGSSGLEWSGAEDD